MTAQPNKRNPEDALDADAEAGPQKAQPLTDEPTMRQMLQGIIADEVMERVAKPLGLDHLPPFDAETADAVIEYLNASDRITQQAQPRDAIEVHNERQAQRLMDLLAPCPYCGSQVPQSLLDDGFREMNMEQHGFTVTDAKQAQTEPGCVIDDIGLCRTHQSFACESDLPSEEKPTHCQCGRPLVLSIGCGSHGFSQVAK
jgi:hypothetical protein